MENVFRYAWRIGSVLGLLLCLLSGVLRLVEQSLVLDFELITIFDVGVGLMVAAGLAKLHLIGESK